MKKVTLSLSIAVLAAGTLLLGGARSASAYNFTYDASNGVAEYGFSGSSFAFTGGVTGGKPADTTIDLSGTLTSGTAGVGTDTISGSILSGANLFESGSFTIDYTGSGTTIQSSAPFKNVFKGGESGDTFTLSLPVADSGGGSSPAVPEASSIVSFGALLALGGLAVIRRRRIA
jgi:MYXO-CTERM domain-containing protein